MDSKQRVITKIEKMNQRKKRGRGSPVDWCDSSDINPVMTYAPAGVYGMGQAVFRTVKREPALLEAIIFTGFHIS